MRPCPSQAGQPLRVTFDGSVGDRSMRSEQLMRWGGLAAVVAGALRTVASFWPATEPGVALEILYLLIDVLILFGILAIYGFQCDRIGSSGFIGFVLAVIGTAIIAGPDGTIGMVNMYAVGSLSLGVGLVVLAVASWMARTLPRWVAILWALSIVTGIVGAAAALQTLFVISGVTFGVGFIGAGLRSGHRSAQGFVDEAPVCRAVLKRFRRAGTPLGLPLNQ